MNVNHTRIKFEVSFPGDDGHVSHRVAEVIRAMTALGIRVEGRLDGGHVYLLHDNEDAVASSTVDDGHAALDAAVEHAVATTAVCGHAVCGHEWQHHDLNKPSAPASAPDRPGTHCRVDIGDGRMCGCPGWTPVTHGVAIDPGQTTGVFRYDVGARSRHLRQGKPGPY